MQNILVIEDNHADFLLLKRYLSQAGVEAQYTRVDSNLALQNALVENDWDVVIADYFVPSMDLLNSLDLIRQHSQYLPTILMSGDLRGEDVVTLLRHGLSDFVPKNDLSRLENAVCRSIEEAHARRDKDEAEAALLASEQSLAYAQKVAQLGSWEWDIQKKVLRWSDELYCVLQIENCPPDYQLILNKLSPDARIVAQRKHDALLEKLEPYSLMHTLNFSDRAEKFVYEQCEVVYNAVGQAVRIIGVLQDVTEQEIANQALSRAASVFRYSHQGILITDAAGVILDVNQAFFELSGYSQKELIGKNASFFASGRHNKLFYETMWQHLKQQGFWRGEIYNRKKNGELFVQLLTLNAVYSSQGTVQSYVALYADISVLKEHQRQLENIAHFDALTGLPNRVLLIDRLRQAIVRAQRSHHRVGVVYLDLDGFKQVNDRYGHQAGDQVLIEAGKRMRHALREGDTLARIGGDEFVAILLELHEPEDHLPILERLVLAANEPCDWQGHTLQVSASIGISFFSKLDDPDIERLLHEADQAMYQAKQAGKNCYRIH